MSFPVKNLLYVACLCCLNVLVSCQETVQVIGIPLMLPGEELTCVHGGFSPQSIQWYLNGEPLTEVPNKIRIEQKLSTSHLTLLTDDAVVTGNYSCRASSSSGTVREASYFVTKAEYSLTVLGETTIKEGSNLSLLCNFTGERAGDVTGIFWNGTKVSQEGELLTVTNATSSLTDRYVCTVRFNFIALTISTNVTIQSTPRINTPIINRVVQTNSVATLVCNITGLGLNYTWLYSNLTILATDRYSVNGGELTITETEFSDAGSYVCTASNIAGSASQVHALTVIGPPDIIAPNSTSATVEVAVNNRTSLFCRSVSYPDSNTSWMHYPADQPGRSVPGDNNRFMINSREELVIMNAAMEDAGAFQCNVTNEHGSAIINITLVVVGPPLLPTDLRLAEVNLTSVQLTWNLSVLSEFRRIEQYRLELSANGGPFNEWEEFEVIQIMGRSVLQMTSLEPGTEYRLRMWTRNLAGTSNTSFNASFLTVSNIPRLEYLRHIVNDNRSLILQWRLLHDGGSPVTNLDVSLVATDSNYREQFRPEINDNHLMINGLLSNTMYTVTVTLRNEQGGSNTTVFDLTIPEPTPSPVLTTALIIVCVTVPFVVLTVVISIIMCVGVCVKKLRVKKNGYPINPAPPPPSEQDNGSVCTGNNSTKLSSSHSQLNHGYHNSQFQNSSSLVRSVTPHLGMPESYSASISRMYSMSENLPPPSASFSNGHVPHFFSPVSVENGSPKFNYPVPPYVHERQSSSTYSLPLSSVIHEETYV